MKRIQQLTCLIWLSLCLAISGCQKTAPETPKAKPLVVSTISIKSSDEPLWVDSLGRVESSEGVTLKAEVSARVKKVFFQPGQAVHKNQRLYSLEDGPYRAKVADTQAALKNAQNSLKKAERDLQRNRLLWQQKAISKQTFEDSKTSQELAVANVDAAKAKWQQAIIDLNHCTIYAPAEGKISASLVNPGDMVTSNSTVLTTVETPSNLRVVFSLSDRLLMGRQPTLQSPVQLRLENGQPLSGQLSYLSPDINTTTGQRTFKAQLQDDHTEVLPGTFVRVRLAVSTLHNVFRVPQKAVQQVSDGTYRVYLYKDGKAVAQPVKVAQWVDTDWIITEGLHPQDEVITDQLIRLRNGLSVQRQQHS